MNNKYEYSKWLNNSFYFSLENNAYVYFKILIK